MVTASEPWPRLTLGALKTPWSGPAYSPPGVPIAAFSDIGGRDENEDRVVMGRVTSSAGVEIFSVLCDGMGGMARGALAAAVAVDQVAVSIARDALGGVEEQPARVLERAVRRADRAVHALLAGRGGAVLAAFIWRQPAHDGAMITVGDARVWTIEDGRIAPLSIDDTLAAQMPDTAGIDPQIAHQPMRFIGQGSSEEWRARHLPGWTEGLLLTSDGAHAIPGDIQAFATRTARTPLDFAERLVVAASWMNADNASAIAARLDEALDSTAPVGAELWVGSERVVLLAGCSLERAPEPVAAERSTPRGGRRRGPREGGRRPSAGPEVQVGLPVFDSGSERGRK